MEPVENIKTSVAMMQQEMDELRLRLEEANDTIDAIRSGQIDALIVQGEEGPRLFTLKSADQAYRVIVEKMTEGAVTLNPKGIILYCNSQFAAMTGLLISNIIGIEFQIFVSESHRRDFSDLLMKCSTSDCKGEVLLISGTNGLPVQLSMATIQLEETAAISMIVTDLSKQKETQHLLSENNQQLAGINKALEASNHDLQQFASVASHDLQEPLRKIQIFSSLLKDEQIELRDEAKSYLEKIIDSSGRMRKLIIDILNYSRLSANDHVIDTVNLHELITDLRNDFELLIEEKKAVINIGAMCTVEASRGQLRQVFQNIISNALKFSKQNVAPVINITEKIIRGNDFNAAEDANGDHCLITIQDNGIGFDQQYLQTIFALFERLNAKDKFEGTGIGLAIAKKILEKFHGKITAESCEGQGSSFKIILPLKQPALP